MKRVFRIPSVRTSLRLLPVGKKLGLIVVLFVFIVACLLMLANVQMEILSAARPSWRRCARRRSRASPC